MLSCCYSCCQVQTVKCVLLESLYLVPNKYKEGDVFLRYTVLYWIRKILKDGSVLYSRDKMSAFLAFANDEDQLRSCPLSI